MAIFNERNYYAILRESIRIGSMVPFDCFLRLNKNNRIIKFLSASNYPNQETFEKLKNYNVTDIYIKQEDIALYKDYLKEFLETDSGEDYLISQIKKVPTDSKKEQEQVEVQDTEGGIRISASEAEQLEAIKGIPTDVLLEMLSKKDFVQITPEKWQSLQLQQLQFQKMLEQQKPKNQVYLDLTPIMVNSDGTPSEENLSPEELEKIMQAVSKINLNLEEVIKEEKNDDDDDEVEDDEDLSYLDIPTSITTIPEIELSEDFQHVISSTDEEIKMTVTHLNQENKKIPKEQVTKIKGAIADHINQEILHITRLAANESLDGDEIQKRFEEHMDKVLTEVEQQTKLPIKEAFKQVIKGSTQKIKTEVMKIKRLTPDIDLPEDLKIIKAATTAPSKPKKKKDDRIPIKHLTLPEESQQELANQISLISSIAGTGNSKIHQNLLKRIDDFKANLMGNSDKGESQAPELNTAEFLKKEEISQKAIVENLPVPLLNFIEGIKEVYKKDDKLQSFINESEFNSFSKPEDYQQFYSRLNFFQGNTPLTQNVSETKEEPIESSQPQRDIMASAQNEREKILADLVQKQKKALITFKEQFKNKEDELNKILEEKLSLESQLATGITPPPPPPVTEEETKKVEQDSSSDPSEVKALKNSIKLLKKDLDRFNKEKTILLQKSKKAEDESKRLQADKDASLITMQKLQVESTKLKKELEVLKSKPNSTSAQPPEEKIETIDQTETTINKTEPETEPETGPAATDTSTETPEEVKSDKTNIQELADEIKKTRETLSEAPEEVQTSTSSQEAPPLTGAEPEKPESAVRLSKEMLDQVMENADELKSSKSSINDLRNKLSAKDNEIKKMQEMLEVLQKGSAIEKRRAEENLGSMLKEKDKTINKSINQIDQQKDTIRSLSREIMALKNETDEANKSKKKFQDKMMEMDSIKLQARKKEDALNNKITMLTNVNNQEKKASAKLAAQVEQLRQEKMKLASQQAKEGSSADQLQKTVTTLKAQIVTLQQNEKLSEKNIKKTNDKMSELQRKLSEEIKKNKELEVKIKKGGATAGGNQKAA